MDPEGVQELDPRPKEEPDESANRPNGEVFVRKDGPSRRQDQKVPGELIGPRGVPVDKVSQDTNVLAQHCLSRNEEQVGPA